MTQRAGTNELILIVDDDRSVITSLALLLKQAGYRSLFAATSSARSQDRILTREDLDSLYNFKDIIGQDPKILKTLEIIGRVSPTDASVLIMGESGTGKELIAEAIHHNSRRKDSAFIKV